MLTVGPVAENCFLLRREGSDRVLIVDPGEEAERILATLEEIGGDGRGDPPHPLPLRPHRRGRAGRRGDRRAGLLPGDRGPDPRRHHGLRPLGGLRPLRELRGRRDRRRRRDAGAGRARDRRHLHARPQPRPRHLLGARRGRDLLRRRPLPGLGRPGRPARRRRADPDQVDPQPARLAPGRDRPSIPATWGRRRSAPSARPTRSSPSWPAEGRAPRR